MESSHRILRALVACQAVVLRSRDEKELLEGICRIAVDIAGYAMAWVGYAEHDAAHTVRPIAFAGIEAGYLAAIRVSHGDGELGRGPTGTAIRTGRAQVTRDLDASSGYAPWRQVARERGFRSSAAFPLVDEGRAFGAFNVYALQPDAFDAEATALLGALATDLAFGITSRRTQDQLRQIETLETIGRLAGNIAHDFNNLLAIIQANTEALRAGAAPARERALLDEVAVAAGRAGDLTRRLLGFSRKGPARREPVALHAIVREVSGLLARTLDGRIALEERLEARHATVAGDASALQSALLNLAVNARDAMPGGGRLAFATRDVVVDAATAEAWPDPVEPGAFVELSVIDTGAGIPEAVRSHVFEPFFTTKDPERGTGLGLAAVRSCARAHGGSVAFDTEPCRGTTFRLILPCAPIPAEAAAPAGIAPVAAPAAPAEIAPAAGAGHVLVVDDEEAILRATGRVLAELGFAADGCADPDEAIARLAAAPHAYDALLLDLHLPGRNGVEVLRELRAVAPGLPVLLCSGHGAGAVPRGLLEDGATGYLAKPYSMEDLAAAMARVRGGA